MWRHQEGEDLGNFRIRGGVQYSRSSVRKRHQKLNFTHGLNVSIIIEPSSHLAVTNDLQSDTDVNSTILIELSVILVYVELKNDFIIGKSIVRFSISSKSRLSLTRRRKIIIIEKNYNNEIILIRAFVCFSCFFFPSLANPEQEMILFTRQLVYRENKKETIWLNKQKNPFRG